MQLLNQMIQNLWSKKREEKTVRSPVSLIVLTHKLKINFSNKSFLFFNSFPKYRHAKPFKVFQIKPLIKHLGDYN